MMSAEHSISDLRFCATAPRRSTHLGRNRPVFRLRTSHFSVFLTAEARFCAAAAPAGLAAAAHSRGCAFPSRDGVPPAPPPQLRIRGCTPAAAAALPLVVVHSSGRVAPALDVAGAVAFGAVGVLRERPSRAYVARGCRAWTAPADKRTARGGEARPGHKEGNVRRLGAAICFKGKQKQTQGGESCRLLPPV